MDNLIYIIEKTHEKIMDFNKVSTEEESLEMTFFGEVEIIEGNIVIKDVFIPLQTRKHAETECQDGYIEFMEKQGADVSKLKAWIHTHPFSTNPSPSGQDNKEFAEMVKEFGNGLFVMLILGQSGSYYSKVWLSPFCVETKVAIISTKDLSEYRKLLNEATIVPPKYGFGHKFDMKSNITSLSRTQNTQIKTSDCMFALEPECNTTYCTGCFLTYAGVDESNFYECPKFNLDTCYQDDECTKVKCKKCKNYKQLINAVYKLNEEKDRETTDEEYRKVASKYDQTAEACEFKSDSWQCRNNYCSLCEIGNLGLEIEDLAYCPKFDEDDLDSMCFTEDGWPACKDCPYLSSLASAVRMGWIHEHNRR